MKAELGNWETYPQYLHEYGLKSTRIRKFVLHILANHGGVLTVEELYRHLILLGQEVNVSTVYRILELFTEKGVTEKIYLPDARKYGFALTSAGHRHRLICLQCHRIVEIETCPLADFERDMAEKHGFAIVGHNLEWYGYCPQCRKQREEKEDFHHER